MNLRLYLVRHEDAGEAESDALRALTGRGRRRMRATGRMVAEREGTIAGIVCSPLVRAVQTAEILAHEISLEDPVEIEPLVAYPPSLERLVERIEDVPAELRSVAFVGHEPTLGVLANHLLGDEGRLRGMSKGSVLALDFERGHGRARFVWLALGDGPKIIEDRAAV